MAEQLWKWKGEQLRLAVTLMNQSWDQTSEVYIVNIVNIICEEPQNQSVERKSLGTFSRHGDGFLCIYWCFIVYF